MNKKYNNKNTGYSNLFILKIIIVLLVALMIIGVIFWQVLSAPDSSSSGSSRMADGVAKFYASFRQSLAPGEEKLNDHTILLPAETQSVTQRLHERAEQVTPDKPEWKGSAKRRAFKENDTIKSALTSFGKEEGVELIWNLKYDYIIKYQFEERTNYTNLVERVTKTVNNDFDGKVKSYFCPLERAVVVTAEEDKYLSEFCVRTTSKRKLKLEKKLEKEYQQRQKLGIN